MKRIILLLTLISVCSCGYDKAVSLYEGNSPIFPDYREVTIPYNIAPLNFAYTSDTTANIVTVLSAGNQQVKIKGHKVTIRKSDWKKLIQQARANDGTINVSSTLAGSWNIYVSPDPIDYAVVYRLIPPGYSLHGLLGIYEYDFQTARQKKIIKNDEVEYSCINCHSFVGTDPTMMCMHFRGLHGCTMITNKNDVRVFNSKTENSEGNCAYLNWHPSGNFIAFSTNGTRQSFYINPNKQIEVYDQYSDLWVYNVKTNTLYTNDNLKGPEFFETFPSFSADGKSLYFCCAPADTVNTRDVLQYNLCRVDFDPETGKIGQDIEIMIDAVGANQSVLFPQESYDGRYLVYTVCERSTFPLYRPEADLWIMDLQTGDSWPLEGANSPDTDSFHNWSTNSRWMVISSRRDDARFTRLYISHIDENGQSTKAFMLPQKDPVKWYNQLYQSYNVPCFVSGPVKLPGHRARQAVVSRKREFFHN